jgi:hypothetical protein
MNFLELLLSESLKNKNPLLDLKGTDRRVLQIAFQDLMNYLKTHWKLVGKANTEYDVLNEAHEHFNSDPKEFQEFLDIWTGIWIKKWNERVKLLIGDGDSQRWNRVNKLLKDAEPIWRMLPNRNELEEALVECLIKNGEICGTSILAENLLKMEVGTTSEKNKNTIDSQDAVNIVKNVFRKARELSHSKGPLIFVRIDKGFFSTP